MVQRPSDTFLPIGVNRSDYQHSRKAKAENIIAILKSQLGELSAMSALDFGCHEGLMTTHLATAFHDITGVDHDPELIAATRNLQANSAVEFHVCTDNQLPFKNGKFDVIIANHVLYYVEDPRFTLREFRRVMKHESICYISTMNGRYTQWSSFLPEQLRAWMLKTLFKSSFYIGNSISYEQYLRLFESFEIVNFTVDVLRNPRTFAQDNTGLHKFLLILLSHFPYRFLNLIARCSPTLIFILRCKKNIYQQTEIAR